MAYFFGKCSLHSPPFIAKTYADKLIEWGGGVFFLYVYRCIANDLGNLSSIPGRVIPKTLKMVLDTSLLNTQQYKVCIEGKVEQSRERSSTLLYTLV